MSRTFDYRQPAGLEHCSVSAVACQEDHFMGLASYKIFGVPGAWHVDHDGKAPNTYDTKEAAFEAAVAAASLALRQGHEVSVTAPGSNGVEPTTGARNLK
jgi:hypothetical protein